MINIAGTTAVNDPAYRYKMPKIVGKVEGKGNGIKTVLLNVNDLGIALKRDPAEITKFFGCELGSQTTFANDRAIVNGAHRDADLQNHIIKYIENFVLCARCKLPETHYKIKEGMISQKCIACGHKEVVDMKHKLCTFIISQHKKSKDQSKKDDKKDKKDGKKEKDSEKVKEAEVVTEKKSSKVKKVKSEEQVDSVFTAATATAAEVEDEPESKIVDEAIEQFKAFLTSNPTATAPQKLEELRRISTLG